MTFKKESPSLTQKHFKKAPIQIPKIISKKRLRAGWCAYPTCKCGLAMEQFKVKKKTINYGKVFWGCMNWKEKGCDSFMWDTKWRDIKERCPNFRFK